jgi:mRNA interferase RelE/StbE
MRQVSYSRSAQKALQKIPRNIAELITSKIDQYARDPGSLANNVKKLKGDFDGLIRLRVGDWRVIMDDEGNVLMILEIKQRGGAYE